MLAKNWEDAAHFAKIRVQHLEKELERSKEREQTKMSREEAAITKQGMDKFFESMGKQITQQAMENAVKDEKIKALEKRIQDLEFNAKYRSDKAQEFKNNCTCESNKFRCIY